MSIKVYDGQGRWCNKTVAFRISPEEDEQLQRFMNEHPDTKLIIIDTLQKIRESGGDKFSYANGYEIVGKLKQFADKNHIRLSKVTNCNEPIKQVYHNLFDEALERYNAKQKRADRRIDNYYEKIRTGKQEKLFHEVILQIGNKDNMAAV